MPSESKADSETLFENLGRAEMTLVGAYPSLFTPRIRLSTIRRTDESSSSETNSKLMFPIMVDYTSTSSMLNSTFPSMYKAIEYSNVCSKNSR